MVIDHLHLTNEGSAMAKQANSIKSIFFALGANFAIFLAKLGAAIYTGSGAMLAEAIHSLADTANQLLLLLGLRQAKQPPDDDHPLGYGKTIYFWSFIVALILFSMGGMFSIYEGVHKLQHPEPLQNPLIGIAVLIFAIAAEGTSLWGCLREVNKIRGNRNLIQWFRESRESELLVVFGEDVAAIFGLVFALGAIGLTIVTGNPTFDALGSIVIGGLLVIIAILIGVEVKELLIGQGVDPLIKKQMVDYLAEQPEIDRVFNVITLQLGKDVMVAVKARPKQFASVVEMIEAINLCETRLQERFPQVVWSFFEPDLRD
jgi:cation diffusion facilitator family transporter